jgi:hypothetical protein
MMSPFLESLACGYGYSESKGGREREVGGEMWRRERKGKRITWKGKKTEVPVKDQNLELIRFG